MSQSATATTRSPRAIRRTRIYIGVVWVVAIVLTWLVLVISSARPQALDVAAFFGLAAIVARAPKSWLRPPISLSFHAVLLLVAVPVIGASGAVLISPVAALLAHRRVPLRATVFNAGMRMCMSASCGLVYLSIAGGLDGKRPSLQSAALGLCVAAVVLGLVNASLLAGVVTLWEGASFRGQVTMLMSETGIGLAAQAVVAYLIYVLWIPVGLGAASLIFGTSSLWASRWVLQQYGHRAQARDRTLAALETAIAVRSPAAAQHTALVAQLCENLAEELAMSAEDIDTARTAGTLHDLDVLVADLPNGERAHMRPLAPTGAISQVTFLASALPALGAERAYPTRGALPTRTAAILAVADAFVLRRDGDGTTQPVEAEAAYGSIRQDSGSGFDPAVVEALGRWLRRSRT
ncbi:MAG: hypothetical protein V9G19_14025 [Tetrasphaera sp.]